VEGGEGRTDLVNSRFDTGSLDYFLELLDVEVRDADAPETQRLIRFFKSRGQNSH
jgi:hypothetical protein